MILLSFTRHTANTGEAIDARMNSFWISIYARYKLNRYLVNAASSVMCILNGQRERMYRTSLINLTYSELNLYFERRQ